MKISALLQESRKPLMEGGNLSVGGHEAEHLDLKVTQRGYMVPKLNELLASINRAFYAKHKAPLWSAQVLKSGEFLSGSSLHFFNVAGIEDETFYAKKPTVGDIDTMVDKRLEHTLQEFLTEATNRQIGAATLLGFQKGNEQFSALFELQDPPVKVQIDFEFVAYDNGLPTDWARFSHSSSWEDIQQGVKGVFHKWLIQSLTTLTNKQFLLRKMTGRGAMRKEEDVPTVDNMYSFAVSSKEGGGLRAKYEPVLNPGTNKPLMKDGLPIMRALPASGYEQDIGKIFSTILGKRLDPKQMQALSKNFWSFTGLVQLMGQLLTPEDKKQVLDGFLVKTIGKGSQGLYKNDPEKDIKEKTTAINYLVKTLGLQLPANYKQLMADYKANYKMTELSEDAPNYKRQGIPHIYKPGSTVEMKDADFIEFCKEIIADGGKLEGTPINLKVDGAGIRFGKDDSGRPFFMTSKVTEPKYIENFGDFEAYGRSVGQDEQRLDFTRQYDNALKTILTAPFMKVVPNDTIIQAEMMYTPMAQQEEGGLKFVNIPYDPKKLGKVMTLVPFMFKQFSTGAIRPDADKIKEALLKTSNPTIKMVNNNLQHKGIDVARIVAPIVKNAGALLTAVKERGMTPAKEKAKAILSQARQQLSNAIINGPIPGKDQLGDMIEGLVVNMPSGRLAKVTSTDMAAKMATKMAARQPVKSNRTKPAVVTVGSFVGHKGHEQLINQTIATAKQVGGDPYVYVSPMVGPEDPIPANVKVETLRKLFPQIANNIQVWDPKGTPMKKIEKELVLPPNSPYNKIILLVGDDRYESMTKWMEALEKRMKDPVALAKYGGTQDQVQFQTVRTERDPSKGGTGISFTMLRDILRDPNATPEQQLELWGRAFDVNKLGKEWIMKLMEITKQGMGVQQQQPVSESRIMDRDAIINAYYVSTKGDRHRVAENIPYYLLDRLVPLLTKKYAITMNDIEVRPVDKNQYRRTSQPELAEGIQCTPNEVAELLYNAKPELFTKFGDEFVMNAIEQACEQQYGSAQEVASKAVEILKQGITEGIFDRFKKKPPQPEVPDPGNYPRIGSDIAQWMAATVEFHTAKHPDSVWKLFCPSYPDYLPTRVRVGTSEKTIRAHLGDYVQLRDANPEAKKLARQKFEPNHIYPNGPREDYQNNLNEFALSPELDEGLNKTPLAQSTVTALQAVLQTHPEWVEQYGAKEVKRVTKYVTRGFWEAMKQDDIKGIVQNVGWELIASAEDIDEAYDHNAPFNAADFNRHMEQLRAREELRKTDPVKALVGDLIDKDNAARNVKKKPQDDSSMDINDPRHPGWGALHNPLGEDDRDGMKDGRPYSDPLRRHPGNESYMTPDYLIQKYQERLSQIAAGPYKRPKEVAQLKSRIAKLQGQHNVDEGSEEALKYATQAHAGQTRSGGDPYITHPMRVADHIRKYKQSHNLDALISAAYLHDTIEDTDTTQEVLHDLFGGLVASLVKELTSDPEQIKKMGKAAYLSHKMAVMSSYGLVIKLADRLDNVKDITTARTPQWRAKYAAETNQILDYIEKTRALSGTHKKLISLIRAKLAEIDNPQQGVTEVGQNFRRGNAQRAAVDAMSPEERKAHEDKRAEQQRKRDDARMERERQRNAAKKGVAEGSEEQWVVTVGTKTGGTSHTMTFSGTKEQAIKKAVARFGTSKNPVVTAKPKQQTVAEAEGITRRGILKGLAGAGALGAAGKASAIAGAFPTPSHQAAMYKAAADSNAAQARADAAEKAKRDAQRLKQGTSDIERLNKINYHGGKVTPTNAEWDGDGDFMYLDGTQYSMASRMPIKGDEPRDMKLISTREGRQVYIWTRYRMKGDGGHYFYPAPDSSPTNEDYLDEK